MKHCRTGPRIFGYNLLFQRAKYPQEGFGIDEADILSVMHFPSVGAVTVVLASEDALQKVSPDETTLVVLQPRFTSFALSAISEADEVDFVSRIWLPSGARVVMCPTDCVETGLFEDPATGSANMALSLMWKNHPYFAGRNSFRIFQASKRGGNLTLMVDTLEPGPPTVHLGMVPMDQR